MLLAEAVSALRLEKLSVPLGLFTLVELCAFEGLGGVSDSELKLKLGMFGELIGEETNGFELVLHIGWSKENVFARASRLLN